MVSCVDVESCVWKSGDSLGKSQVQGWFESNNTGDTCGSGATPD